MIVSKHQLSNFNIYLCFMQMKKISWQHHVVKPTIQQYSFRFFQIRFPGLRNGLNIYIWMCKVHSQWRLTTSGWFVQPQSRDDYIASGHNRLASDAPLQQNSYNVKLRPLVTTQFTTHMASSQTVLNLAECGSKCSHCSQCKCTHSTMYVHIQHV